METIINVDEFKAEARQILNKLEDLVAKMPNKGDRADESQKVFLKQAINEVHYGINALFQSDFIEGIDD